MGKRGSAPKRNKAQRENDLVDIARMYCEGKSFAAIALRLTELRTYSLTSTTIFQDVQTIRKRWTATVMEAVEERRAIEMGKIDRLEQEAWDAWHKSLSERQIRQTSTDLVPDEKAEGGKPTKFGRMLKVEQSWGDPRFMAVIQWCIDRRCRLLGLDAPERVEDAATLRQLAREVAEQEGLEESEVLQEAQRIFAATKGFR